MTTVLLESDLSPNQVLAFYQDQLAKDWAVIHAHPSSGGLVDVVQSQGNFCKLLLGPSLILLAHAYPERP